MENIQVYEFMENNFEPNYFSLDNNLIRGKENITRIIEPILKP